MATVALCIKRSPGDSNRAMISLYHLIMVLSAKPPSSAKTGIKTIPAEQQEGKMGCQLASCMAWPGVGENLVQGVLLERRNHCMYIKICGMAMTPVREENVSRP